MKDGARYDKRVEWSDVDQCFVGSCPGVIGPCCHGDDEEAVYRELCRIVDEWLEVTRDDPVAAALATAPMDDEPVTPGDAEAIAEGERDVKDGRVVSEAELRVRLGL